MIQQTITQTCTTTTTLDDAKRRVYDAETALHAFVRLVADVHDGG